MVFGLGFWTRGETLNSVCFATRGKPRRQSNRVHQFIISPLRQHSQKPSESQRKNRRAYGRAATVGCCFAREKADGWDTWGDEVACDVEINSRPETTGRWFMCLITGSYRTYRTLWILGMKNWRKSGSFITQSPEEFKGGTIWSVIVDIHGAVQAIGLAL